MGRHALRQSALCLTREKPMFTPEKYSVVFFFLLIEDFLILDIVKIEPIKKTRKKLLNYTILFIIFFIILVYSQKIQKISLSLGYINSVIQIDF